MRRVVIDSVKLFGNDAGEEESTEFLKEVYVESDAYKRAIRDERVLCVRSRKGVGKSALLVRARLQAEQDGILALKLSPTELFADAPLPDFNAELAKAKRTLARLCAAKIAAHIKLATSGDAEKAIGWAEEDGFRSTDLIARIARAFQDVAHARVEETAASDQAAPAILARLSEGSPLYVFIDDLDRGWSVSGPGPGSSRVAAVIGAVREIARDCGTVRFRLALREDVWQYLERRDEQMDKFRQYTQLLSWNNKEIVAILARRVKSYLMTVDGDLLKNRGTDYDVIDALFEVSYKWHDETKRTADVLATLSRRRPRDLLQLAKGAAERARKEGSRIIRAEDVRQEYELTFSRVRALDLAKEFLNECPEVEKLFQGFAGKRPSWALTYEQVMQCIRSVNGRLSVQVFGRTAMDVDCLAFLYRAGFLSARKEDAGDRYQQLDYNDFPQLVDAGMNPERYFWEPHPAFRPYLESIATSEYQRQKRKEKNRRG